MASAEQLAELAPAALALVPGCGQGALPQRAERLRGGTVNDVWRVDTVQGRFVLRLDGPAWRRPGVDRQRELLLHGAAAAAGLAPRIIAADVAAGALVTEFIEGRLWTPGDYGDGQCLRRLGERLAQLHRVPSPRAAIAPFAPADIAAGYAALQPARDAALAAYLISLQREVARAHCLVAEAGRQVGVVHGDPTQANLLQGECLWLLDWEYAQLADPLYDVAAVLAYYPAAVLHQRELFAGAQLQADPRRLAAAVFVHQALGWLWLHARGEAPPPGTGISAHLSAN